MVTSSDRQEDGVAIELQPERGRRSVHDPRSHAAPRRSDAAPICGVTVLPLTASLLAVGVSLAQAMAFWLSVPITDPAMR